jgi:nardilysin
LAEELAPSNPLPPERLLDGSALLFEYDPIAVKELLDEYLTPQNARIDLLSSTFGRAADFEAEENAVSPVSSDVPVVDSKPFKASEAGTPEIEPMFGTPFWRRQLIDAQIASWSEAFAAALPRPDSLLSLPPKNPFVPDCYALKPLPPDDDDHPLVHSSLKLCVTIGKKKVRKYCCAFSISSAPSVTVFFLRSYSLGSLRQ